MPGSYFFSSFILLSVLLVNEFVCGLVVVALGASFPSPLAFLF